MIYGSHHFNFSKYFLRVDYCCFRNKLKTKLFDKTICRMENPKLGLSDNYKSLI